jgi:hypothetical protein
MRICTKCKTPKSETEFSRRKSKSGYNSHCKKCRNEAKKLWCKNNKEHIKNEKMKWDEENKKHVASYQEATREHRLLVKSEYYSNHKDEITVKSKEWRRNNPEKQSVIARRCNTKRQRELGFNPLNDYFEGSVAHHVNKNDVVYVSESAHKFVPHNLKTGKNMDTINKIAFVSCVMLTGQVVGGVRI